MNEELINVKTLPVITKFIYTIGQLPSSYMMSMTYEEQVVWLCNYLEKEVIPALNNNAQAVQELQHLYELLKEYVDSYFENLDVQEEINTKIEEMVENGELAQILNKAISQKIQVQTLGINPGTLTNDDVDTINTYIENHHYCSLEFGSGVYVLPKSIVLLQGSSISGIGNDTVLKPEENVWAIICKGLETLNATTEIYNLKIDGNFNGNGIYVDATRYSRCEIHDLFIVSCKYAFRNAEPNVAGVYDNNFNVGNGGNNFHDMFIYGETPNYDTSRCIDGMVLYANDNFLSNIRVMGFNNYGVKINGVGYQYSNFKSCVNHISMYIRGQHHVGEVCADESFQNNIELDYLRNSNLVVKTASAGCVVSESLPNVLDYYDVLMTNCSQNTLEITGIVAQSFAYRKAGEKAVLKLQDSLLNDIKINFGNSQVPNAYCVPLESNCAFINNIKINTEDYTKFISYNILEDLTAGQAGGTTLTGTYPNLHVVYNGSSVTQNMLYINLTEYVNDNLLVACKSFGSYPPQLYQLGYKFNEESTGRSYVNQTTQFHSSYGQNGAVFFSIRIKDVLETIPEYNESIREGHTLQYVRLFFRCTHAKAGESDYEVYIVNES